MTSNSCSEYDRGKAGNIIEIKFNPMRDGSQAGGFIGAKFKDGSTIGRWQASQERLPSAPATDLVRTVPKCLARTVIRARYVFQFCEHLVRRLGIAGFGG